MQNQVYVFIIFIINGLLIGFLFDIFRIFRKSFKTPDIITYIQDVAFWIIGGVLLLYSIFKFNNGELRIYIFLGILLGFLLYMLIFSKIFIKISICCFNITKKIINTIIIPIKYILKILTAIIYKPTKFMYSTIKKIIRKIIYFFKRKSKKVNLNDGIYKNKKDFA